MYISFCIPSLYFFSYSFSIHLQNDGLSALYVIQKGHVKITFDSDLLRNPNVSSLMSDNLKDNDNPQSSPELSVEKIEGSYFGEWALIGEYIDSLRAVAMGNVVCALLTKENFDSVVGPLTKLSEDEHKYVETMFSHPIFPFKCHGYTLELIWQNNSFSFKLIDTIKSASGP